MSDVWPNVLVFIRQILLEYGNRPLTSFVASFCLIVFETTLKHSIWPWNLRTAFPLFKILFIVLFIVPYIVVPISEPQRVFGPLRLSSWVQMRLLMGQMRLLMSTYLIGVSCHLCHATLSPGKWWSAILSWNLVTLGEKDCSGVTPQTALFAGFCQFCVIQ